MIVLASIQRMLLQMLGSSYLSKGGAEPAFKTCPGGVAADHNPFHLKTRLWLPGILFGEGVGGCAARPLTSTPAAPEVAQDTLRGFWAHSSLRYSRMGEGGRYILPVSSIPDSHWRRACTGPSVTEDLEGRVHLKGSK